MSDRTNSVAFSQPCPNCVETATGYEFCDVHASLLNDRDQTPSEVDFKRQWDAAQEHQREEWAWQMFDALNAERAPVEPPVLSREFLDSLIEQTTKRLDPSPNDAATVNTALQHFARAILESLS